MLSASAGGRAVAAWSNTASPNTGAERRSEEVTPRPFSLRLYGIHPGQAQRASWEAAAALDGPRTALSEAILECAALERSIATERRQAQDLRERLRVAEAALAAYKEQQRRLPRELARLEEASARRGEAARTHAGELAARARDAARAMTRQARTAALETLRSARAVAQARTRVAELFASAGKFAGLKTDVGSRR
jgi:ABC-type transporter Mla subunit MlaD